MAKPSASTYVANTTQTSSAADVAAYGTWVGQLALVDSTKIQTTMDEWQYIGGQIQSVVTELNGALTRLAGRWKSNAHNDFHYAGTRIAAYTDTLRQSAANPPSVPASFKAVSNDTHNTTQSAQTIITGTPELDLAARIAARSGGKFQQVPPAEALAFLKTYYPGDYNDVITKNTTVTTDYIYGISSNGPTLTGVQSSSVNNAAVLKDAQAIVHNMIVQQATVLNADVGRAYSHFNSWLVTPPEPPNGKFLTGQGGQTQGGGGVPPVTGNQGGVTPHSNTGTSGSTGTNGPLSSSGVNGATPTSLSSPITTPASYVPPTATVPGGLTTPGVPTPGITTPTIPGLTNPGGVTVPASGAFAPLLPGGYAGGIGGAGRLGGLGGVGTGRLGLGSGGGVTGEPVGTEVGTGTGATARGRGATGTTGSGMYPPMYPPSAGGMGGRDDERRTSLVEDEDFWQVNVECAPPVVSGW
jgi:hypothetical protein